MVKVLWVCKDMMGASTYNSRITISPNDEVATSSSLLLCRGSFGVRDQTNQKDTLPVSRTRLIELYRTVFIVTVSWQ